MKKLEKFLEEQKPFMLKDISQIVQSAKARMEIDPNEYTENGCDEPTIDVRLCIDLERGDEPTWIIRVGLVDYDPYHSDFCSASCIGLNTNVSELLEELINGLE